MFPSSYKMEGKKGNRESELFLLGTREGPGQRRQYFGGLPSGAAHPDKKPG